MRFPLPFPSPLVTRGLIFNGAVMRNDLVLEAGEVKARIHAEQLKNASYVHTDWLRFTIYTQHAPAPEVCFPPPADFPDDAGEELDFLKAKDLEDYRFSVASQAAQIAWDVATLLGPDYKADLYPQKGKDFYAWRLDILRKGHPVGWVGFLSTSQGLRGAAQAKTVHVNLEGMGCTFARPGWREAMADYIDRYRGLLTRVDLAVDFFEGIKGGMERLPDQYKSGFMDHLGQRPAHKRDGTWDFDDRSPNKGRSYYIGSRQAGKQTNVYEKGLKEFGHKSGNPWVRFELRYGNQKRVLPTDILRRPADFFAGASDWHSSVLKERGAQSIPEEIPQEKVLPVQSIEAEVERNARWFLNTAGASFRLVFQHLNENKLLDLLEDASAVPGRLKKFASDEIASVYNRVFERISQTGRADAVFC